MKKSYSLKIQVMTLRFSGMKRQYDKFLDLFVYLGLDCLIIFFYGPFFTLLEFSAVATKVSEKSCLEGSEYFDNKDE